MKFAKSFFAAALALTIIGSTNLCVSAADTQISKSTIKQTADNVIRLLKNKTNYSYKQGRLYLTEGEFTYMIHLSLKKGGSYAQLIAYSGSDTEITVPAYAGRFPVRKIFSFGQLDENYRYSVTTLNLPETVTDISGADVFDLFGLQNINIDPKNPYLTSVDGVAFSKNLKKLLALPPARKSYSVPDSVTVIGDFACYASELETVTFPKNLRTVGKYAFFSSPRLTEISLPRSTRNIGDSAFAHCVNLQKAALPLSANIAGNAFDAVSNNFIVMPIPVKSV